MVRTYAIFAVFFCGDWGGVALKAMATAIRQGTIGIVIFMGTPSYYCDQVYTKFVPARRISKFNLAFARLDQGHLQDRHR